MPWKMSDAKANTKKADTPAKKAKFAAVANAVLRESGDDVKALKIAKAAVAKPSKKGTTGAATAGMRERQTKAVTRPKAY